MTIETEILERLERIENILSYSNKPELITAKQASIILDISLQTLYKYAKIWPLIDKNVRGIEKYKASEIRKLRDYLKK